MRATRTSRVLWGILPALITAVLCPLAQGKVIRVDDNGQADFNSIQAGIDAADHGDIVWVAPGTYRENVILRDGIALIGSGAGVTIIDAQGYGDVVDARANDAAIGGFTLKNSGESDLAHMNCGVYVEGSYAPVVKSNVIVGNRIGIGAWYGAHPDVRNNVIENNSDGLYVYGSKEDPTTPHILNNTIVGNQTDGIVLREKVSPVITNNIIVGHAAGINRNYVTGTPVLSYNNLWDNDVNYLHDGEADDTLGGPGSMSVDPCFAKGGYWADVNDPNVAVVEHNGQNAVWMAGDYHLLPGSPCIDAGDPNFAADPNKPESDVFGGPRFAGARIDIGADEYGKRLPDDLVEVGGAGYASLTGLARGSGDAQEQQKQAVETLGLPLEVKTRQTGIVLRLVPGGTFIMGSPLSEPDRQIDEIQHQVTLTKPFYCGKFEVTQGQWQQVMGGNPSDFQSVGLDAPVERVSWDDCQIFLTRLCGREGVPDGTYRLLTEAEWEYACRAGSTSAYCFGDNVSVLAEYAWYRDNSGMQTHPVGLKKPNAFGLYDMHGNVWEWCQDWYATYPNGTVTDPPGGAWGPYRLVRGGVFGYFPKGCRSAIRNRTMPVTRYDTIGLRLVRTSPSST